MALKLPEIVANYYAAEASGDYAALAQCFAENGWIRDEGHTHSGRTAIAQWMAAAKEKYHHETEPALVGIHNGRIVVSARVTGQFPGSPVTLDQVFVLAGGQILSLEIG